MTKLTSNTRLQRLFSTIGSLPTTQLRILLTMVVVLGTAVQYLVSDQWEPSGEWLMFLASMMGIDTLHFIGKRATQFRPTDYESLGSTDQQEGIG